MKKFFRQGDVGLLYVGPVTDIPPNATPKEKDAQRGVVLAYGEVTGHAHVVDSQTAVLFSAPSQTTAGAMVDLLRVDSLCAVVHEEHTKIELDPGVYQVIRQTEYTPQGWVQVAD
jgi:hypothetical protein